MKIVQRYTHGLFKYRWIILLISLGLTLFFAFQLRHLSTLNSVEALLPEHDPALQEFKKFNHLFGGDFILMGTFETSALFSPEFLAELKGMTEELEKISDVDHVVTLANMIIPVDNNGTLESRQWLEKLPQTPQEALALQKQIEAEPFVRSLVSEDATSTAFYITLKNQKNLEDKRDARTRVMNTVPRLLKIHQHTLPFQFRLAGHVALEEGLDVEAQKMQTVSSLIILGMVSLIFYFLFRRISGVLFCLGLVGTSFIWLMGLTALLHEPLNFATSILPPLILVIAVLDCIHVYALFRSQPLHLPAEKKVQNTLEHFFVPGVLTFLTTSIGFASLASSDMAVIRHFGFFAVAGITFAFLLTMGPFAIVLTWLPEAKAGTPHKINPWLTRMVDGLVHLNRRHWRAPLIISCILFVFCSLGAKSLMVETKPIRFFPPNSTLRQDIESIDQKFGGTTTVDILLEGEPGTFDEPENWQTAEKISQGISHVRYLSPPLTLVDRIKQVNQMLHSNDPAFGMIPSTRQELAEVFLILESDPGFSRLLTGDHATLRINSRIQTVGTREGKQVSQDLKTLLAQTLPASLHSTITGTNVVWMNMEDYIVHSLLSSFLTSFVAICVLMAFVFRSWKMGLVSMIPNVLPILGILGLMGWLGIPLNMVTMAIASIALGLAVDDTVHVMVELQKEMKTTRDISVGLEKTFHHLGLPIISTSTILALGFWALCFCDFVPTFQFGLLSGLTILMGLLAELLLFPAVLKALGKWIFN